MHSKSMSTKVSKPLIPLNLNKKQFTSDSSDEDLDFVSQRRHSAVWNGSSSDEEESSKSSEQESSLLPSENAEIYVSYKQRKLVAQKEFDSFNNAAIRMSRAWSDHFHGVLECYDRLNKRSKHHTAIYDMYEKSSKCVILLFMRASRNRKRFAQMRITSLERALKLVKHAFSRYLTVYKDDYTHRNAACADDQTALDRANDDSEYQRKHANDVEQELNDMEKVLRKIRHEYS